MSDPAFPNPRSKPEGDVFDREATSPLDPDALAIEDQQRALLVRVFSLLLVGLMTSAAVGYVALKNADLHQNVLRHELGFQVMFLFEIAAVAFVSKYVSNFSIAMTWVVFIFYSALNGISFAMFFVWLPPTSVIFGFFLTALTFGCMALYGHYTKADLGSVKCLSTLVLIGLCLMAVLNVVLGHDEHFYATSFLGIMFFAGLTASHIQDIRNLDWEFEDDDASNDKAALVGALLIYLDFVNLYMLFIRFIGQTRTRQVRS